MGDNIVPHILYRMEVIRLTKNEAINIILNIARLELDYHEKASNKDLDDKYLNSGSSNYTKYARDLDAISGFYNGKKQGFAWCDVTYDWFHYKAWGAEMAMQVLCQPKNSAGAGCLFSAQYYKQYGRWHEKNPCVGDQIFFSYNLNEYSHTGLVESVSSTTIITIEGNTSNMIARRSYNINDSHIIGYGTPRWELLENFDYNNIPKDGTSYQDDIKKEYKYKERNLFNGCIGEDVKILQENLLKLNYKLPKYGADGDFGSETLGAVKSFQKDNGLEVSGVVTTEFYNLLDKNLLNQKNTTTQEFKIGDIVIYKGGIHYTNAYSNYPISCKNGRAKITDIYLLGKSKHPYHLIALYGGGSNVYGWVDEGSFIKE